MGRYAQYRKRGRADAQASACPVVGAAAIEVNQVGPVVFYDLTPSADMDMAWFLFIEQATSSAGPWITIASGAVGAGDLTGDTPVSNGTWFRGFSRVNGDGTGCQSDISGPIEAA